MQIKVVVVGLFLLLAAEMVISHGSPTANSALNPSNSQAVTVTLTDNSLQLSEGSVTSGSATFTVTNNGTMEHEFVVLKTDVAADALPLQPDGTAVEENADIQHIGELESLQPGETKTLTLSLALGNYVLLCNLPGHYQAGMVASFEVK
jgi:uncharacterized cupredoxin-like copper-binding protein